MPWQKPKSPSFFHGFVTPGLAHGSCMQSSGHLRHQPQATSRLFLQRKSHTRGFCGVLFLRPGQGVSYLTCPSARVASQAAVKSDQVSPVKHTPTPVSASLPQAMVLRTGGRGTSPPSPRHRSQTPCQIKEFGVFLFLGATE